MVGFNGKNYVFFANSERSFEMKEVQTGIRFDGHIEILSGINPDMQLLDKGSFQLLAIIKNAGEQESEIIEYQFNSSKKVTIIAILLKMVYIVKTILKSCLFQLAHLFQLCNCVII